MKESRFLEGFIIMAYHSSLHQLTVQHLNAFQRLQIYRNMRKTPNRFIIIHKIAGIRSTRVKYVISEQVSTNALNLHVDLTEIESCAT